MEPRTSMGDIRIRQQYVLKKITLCCMMIILHMIVFNHTRDLNYLTTARRMAKYFVDHISSDGIVPWCVWPVVPLYTGFYELALQGFQCTSKSTPSGRQFGSDHRRQRSSSPSKYGKVFNAIQHHRLQAVGRSCYKGNTSSPDARRDADNRFVFS